MSTDTSKPNIEDLHKVIDKVTLDLLGKETDTKQFADMVDVLEKLHKVNALNKDEDSVKLKDVLPLIGNLAGILAILNFERAHVVTSKALAFVLKTKS